MTATKKKPQSKPQSKPSGGTLMSMRAGFQKVTGTGASNKKKAQKSKWTFQQVMLFVGLAALGLALVYAFTGR